MQRRTLTLLSFLLATAFLVQQTEAACNKCQANGIMCTGRSTYKLCYEDDKVSAEEFNCLTGVCTRLAEKCIEGAEPYCKPDLGCATCDGTQMFTCTSRTTYAQCNGREITTNTGKCPPDMICSSAAVGICVSNCGNAIECNREAPVTP